MNIYLAQTKPVKGDIAANISYHVVRISEAITQKADAVFFAELSLTGYEPTLAKELATTQSDERLDVFQELSNANNIVIGVGLPIQVSNGVQIGMVVFQPNTPRITYAKQYLHADELPHFVPGAEQVFLEIGDKKIALAICYELSIEAHAEYAHQHGAGVYIASVAKTADGVKKSHERLAHIAKQYNMEVYMVNCVGECDGDIMAGGSAKWNSEGEVLDETNSH